MVNDAKILIVDDEPDVVEILSYNLNKENFKVFKAYNGKDGLMLAEEVLPDLIIMDIRMPGMTGIEACRSIKKNKLLENIPVLFLTADSDEYTSLNAIEAGGDHLITKPIRPAILIGMIRDLLKK